MASQPSRTARELYYPTIGGLRVYDKMPTWYARMSVPIRDELLSLC